MKQVGKKNMIFFFSSDHYLSQWYPCRFVIDDIEFTSSEQWMMYAKAILFQDLNCAKAILATSSAKRQKNLGKKVSYFDDKIWNIHKKRSFLQGILLSFRKMLSSKAIYYRLKIRF